MVFQRWLQRAEAPAGLFPLRAFQMMLEMSLGSGWLLCSQHGLLIPS